MAGYGRIEKGTHHTSPGQWQQSQLNIRPIAWYIIRDDHHQTHQIVVEFLGFHRRARPLHSPVWVGAHWTHLLSLSCIPTSSASHSACADNAFKGIFCSVSIKHLWKSFSPPFLLGVDPLLTGFYISGCVNERFWGLCCFKRPGWLTATAVQ